EILEDGESSSGIYTVHPCDCCPHKQVKVYCDMDTDKGGWTVIQRRGDYEIQEDFQRTWIEYSIGFGDIEEDFWLGNDMIHCLTEQTLNEIRVELSDFDDEERLAHYKFFHVANRSDNHVATLRGYTGTAGDSLIYHSGKPFSTEDKDVDETPANCATLYKGGWWYGACHSSNLNGLYLNGTHVSYADGVNWRHWHGYHYSLKTTEMKIRP
ncbi:unnamed protein product, partial [Meganyctiphanes norvegica]